MTALETVRSAMREGKLDALLVPMADPYLSEYVAPHWSGIARLSGFTGSAGALVVLQHEAALATDSRYWEQAGRELVDGVELIAARRLALEEAALRAAERLPEGGVVGIDERFISERMFHALEEFLMDRGLRLVDAPGVSEAGWSGRPARPMSAVHPMRCPGRDAAEKFALLRAEMRERGAEAFLTAALDEVAWMTNLRGADIPCNPVFGAVLWVRMEHAVLFSEAERFDAQALAHLKALGVELARPETLPEVLAQSGRLWVDSERTSAALLRSAPGNRIEAASPVERMKSRKTEQELSLIREAMLRDAVALTEFYAELDERLAAGWRPTEGEAAALMHEWRARDEAFLDESFETISAFGPNAALPHYAPKGTGGAVIEGNGFLLMDSGGHYECGTTDVTRMTPVGEPTEEMKIDAARVTRGMLRLLECRFPEGTTGAALDAFARYDLWQAGCDFGHGTGHGVGYVLNVHEGPVTISPRGREPLAAGNVLSDEPGIYRPGRWGVRVENLVCVKEAGETEFGRFLATEPLTLVPIDVRTLPEPFGEGVEALNRFNARCVEALRERVSERARAWLERAARPIA